VIFHGAQKEPEKAMVSTKKNAYFCELQDAKKFPD